MDARTADAGKRPNFLLIMTDQQCADHLGAYGNKMIKTPQLDALARDGMIFDRFYVNSPVCMPNRAALATGRMPGAAGVRMNGVPLPLSSRTFADALLEDGYRTSLIGKAHFQNMTEAAPTAAPGEPELPRARQASSDTRDCIDYGIEAPEQWRNPGFSVPRPYYGFEDVVLCLEHGDTVGGDFERWLQNQRPTTSAAGPDSALVTDIPVDAPQAWRTALVESEYPTHFIAERSIEWLRAHAEGDDKEKPFLMQCSFPDPHHPFTPPGRYWSMYPPGDIELPASFTAPIELAPPHKRALHEEFRAGERRTSGSRAIAVTAAEARQAIALNYGAITMVDDAVGRIVNALRELRLDDNTVIIFLSDHGDFMGDHGLLFKGPLHYQSVVRMPFIWRDTESRRHTGRCAELACAMDLAPTILARAGVMPYHGIQGQSLAWQISGMKSELDRTVLIEEQSHRSFPGLPNPPLVRTLITQRWRLSIYPGTDWGELYDLQADSDEIHNRFSDPACLAIRAQLLWQMSTEMARLGPNLPLPACMA